MPSKPPPDDIRDAIASLQQGIPSSLDAILRLVQKERDISAEEIARLHEEIAYSQLVLGNVVQPVLCVQSDMKINFANKSFRDLTEKSIEALLGRPVGEYITGLDTLDLPIPVEDVPVTVQLLEAEKTKPMRATVDYFPIGEGKELHYRAAIYLLETAWLSKFSWVKLPRKNKPIILKVQEDAPGKGITTQKTPEGKYRHTFFTQLVSTYLHYKNKDIALNFGEIKQCDDSFITTLMSLYETLYQRRETFTLTILNPTEYIKTKLLETSFPENQIRSIKK